MLDLGAEGICVPLIKTPDGVNWAAALFNLSSCEITGFDALWLRLVAAQSIDWCN